MPDSALTPVVDDKIWTFDRPVWFSGVRQRARTTVLRLEDGGLLLHSPAPPTDALTEQLRALGPVRWLLVLPLLGVPFLDETVLYHRPTQTLLGADIVLCACTKDHWTLRWAARITGFYERVRVPPDVEKKIPHKSAAARSIHTMLQRYSPMLRPTPISATSATFSRGHAAARISMPSSKS